jgi:nitroreductase
MTPFGLTHNQFDDVLEAACRAPSLHNSQPWSFLPIGDRLELRIDPGRLLRVCDPDARETRIGCGAALFNLRLALSRYGVKAVTTVLPHGTDGPLAVIVGGGSTVSTPELAAMERAIRQRRTNRRPFSSAEVSLDNRHSLTRAVEAEGGVLHFIDEPERLRQIREQAAVAHRIQLADPEWVAEWNAWTARVDSNDGVPLSAAGPKPAPQDFYTLRDFGNADRRERKDGQDFEQEPLIAVLATHADSAVNQVHAGQAMQRLLLAATVLGMSASFLSQLIEVPSPAAYLRSLTGGYSYPQVVLRMGFGSPAPPTPRRPVEECMLVNDDNGIHYREQNAHSYT